MLTKLLACQFTDSSINGCEEFEILLILFFPENAWFSGICTDPLYQYGFPISLGMLSLDVLTYTMLSLVTCLISPHVMLTPDTRHVAT